MDSSCDVSISSFTDPECTASGNEQSTTTESVVGASDGGNEQSTTTESAVIGTFVGVVVLLVLVIVVILVIAQRRNQQASLKLQ